MNLKAIVRRSDGAWYAIQAGARGWGVRGMRHTWRDIDEAIATAKRLMADGHGDDLNVVDIDNDERVLWPVKLRREVIKEARDNIDRLAGEIEQAASRLSTEEMCAAMEATRMLREIARGCVRRLVNVDGIPLHVATQDLGPK